MILRVAFALLSMALLGACTSQEKDATPQKEAKKTSSAEQWISKVRTAHGSNVLTQSKVTFQFRDAEFLVKKDGYDFYYQRQKVDTAGRRIIDQVWPDSTFRTIDGEKQQLTPKKARGISESLHSVVYFAYLPEALNDPAVRPSYVDSVHVKGEPYHRIKVTFSEENGGPDHEDEYLYWFHGKDHTLDYLAYNFQVNGGGARFRAAENPRKIAGIRLQDYKNYTPTDGRMDLTGLDTLFEKGDLKLLSEIDLENIEVAALEE
jgi:hypothetical protein